jgi:hypothetical protein
MSSRTVKDEGGRNWVCTEEAGGSGDDGAIGKDVRVSCTTPSVPEPIRIMVGWQWAKMADKGLARMIAAASPVPRG